MALRLYGERASCLPEEGRRCRSMTENHVFSMSNTKCYELYLSRTATFPALSVSDWLQ